MGSAGSGGGTASPRSASVVPAPRKLRSNTFGEPAWRPGRCAGGTGGLPAPLVPPAARGAPDARCCRAALRVSGPPRRGSGSGPGGGARQQPHGRGTAAAAGPPLPRERLGGDSGTGRPRTGRATGDPAAGPLGLGGLGRPLPLQSSEMAEHVAIMPRHSGCPARLALISGPRTPLLFPCAPRMGNKTQHVSAAPAHKAPGLGLSGGQSGPSISAPGPLCPSPPCHTFCSRIQ